MNNKLKLRNSIRIISVLNEASLPCKGFGKKPVSCNCLAHLTKQPYHCIENTKRFFIAMANDIWNINVEKNELLHKIADYLCQYCTNASLMCPMFEFNISQTVCSSVSKVTICWRSLRNILCISRLEAQCIKKLMNNRRQCVFYWNKVDEQKEYLRKYGKQNNIRSWSNYFPKELIMVVEESVKARQLIEKKLNGRIMSLSVKSCAELDVLVANHRPNPSRLYSVTNGGHNILFGPFAKLSSGWNTLSKRYRHFHTEMVMVTKSLWQDVSSCPYMKPTYMVSKQNFCMSSDPQVAHTDFDPFVCQQSKNIPYVAFAPCCKEGSMLMVWTKDCYETKENRRYYCHFYLYIPYGVMLYLPGDVIHAGGFCFGRKPTNQLSNERVHFYICDGNDSNALADALDNKNHNKHEPEYVPDPEILSRIKERLVEY